MKRIQVLLERCICPFADYPADLNAVHEAVTAATAEHFRAPYWESLREVMGWLIPDHPVYKYHDDYGMVNASALHHCIALLMTVAPDKWEAIKNDR